MSKRSQTPMDQSPRSGRSHISVLTCFPPTVARDVAVAVVTPLGISLGNPNSRSLLRTEAQVKWTMEVLCYALSLPLDCDTVKLCVDIYTNWLLVLVSPRDSIPLPIIKEPNIYAQKILRHLLTLFLSRRDESGVAHQALCQQVLSAVQLLAREGTAMSQDTWETLLHFLLCVNQSVLAPPTSAPVSQQLSHLSMDVLFQVWLLSCSRCFPSRSLWLSWKQMMRSWRYQLATVDRWTRVVSALTSRLLPLTFGPAFPSFKVPFEDAALIPADLDHQCTLQTWFRFLHVLSNPADLRRPLVDGPAPLSQEDVFLTAMTAVSKMVHAFLGVSEECSEDQQINSGLAARIRFRDRLPSVGVAVTRSPFKDRLPSYGVSRPRSGSAPPTPVNILSLPSSNSPPPLHGRLKTPIVSKATSSQTSQPLHHWMSTSGPALHPSPLRGKVDSLLRLFGCFLFDAAVLDGDSAPAERWATGRAEACGTLCTIFSCKKSSEDILPVHLSRFYVVLLQGLQVSEEMSPPVLASILLNSSSLFCCDLPGVNLLLPSFISALENVLLDKEQLSFKTFVSPVDLRRASILILMSLLPLPQQFGHIYLEVLLSGQYGGDDVTSGSVLSLKPRLLSLLIVSLQAETDSTNMQMLLAAMMILVQDSALLEAAEQTQQQRAKPSRTKRTAGPTTAAVLWVQFLHLLTQHLMSQWRNDSAVCLAVMEVLGGLAKVKVGVAEAEKRRAVTWVCRHIEFQCGRPPPLHSRDLHSIIVAAFYCLSTWLTEHPAILEHQDCLLEVLETVELGISGSKSRQEEEVRCKEEKELNPVSLRVKDAAEVTLNCIMQVSGTFPSPAGSLDEDALMCGSGPRDRNLSKMRYFAVDAFVILGILEQAHGPENVSVPCPSLTALIRGPWSRHTWTLQHHLQPREGRRSTKTLSVELQRDGEAREDAGTSCGVKLQPLPENVSKAPSVKADLSIPDLLGSVTEQFLICQILFERLRVAVQRQQQVEDQLQVSSRTVAMTTCLPPPPAAHFQTARLFLSQMGLLTPETLKDPVTGGMPAQLASLDPSLPGFFEDLRRLDQLPSRNRDTIFVFYVRAGQKAAAEILRNVESSRNVSSHFLDFLSSLGWPSRAGHGQEGVTSTCTPEFLAVLGESGGRVFDGDTFVLKYADALTDITFIVPSSSSHANWSKRRKEAGHSERSTAEGVRCLHVASSLLIVWLERSEDIESFPLCQLLSLNKAEAESSVSHVQIIFIRRLKSGLFHITVREKSSSKLSLVLPLLSGSVLSKRCLGVSVREMAINCCRRRQLWSDSAPTPHVRRKQMISDIISRYRCRHSEPAFYSALFHDP
ncbi:ral GTPase-activating protein subunit beta [Dunckerocampus dactyliophorus]|uniref:ral GTPase-activating protein subunit beta n=1 Tax=Dunckerocampus dactyliophorus TaxID=161453 RepID=UPI002405A1ED|nr:ral GTPase-activating protein subunit beta [Dunckerocampus dactyliophorus]